MIFISFFCLLTATLSSSTINTHNLTHASQRLIVRMPSSDGSMIDFSLEPRLSMDPFIYSREDGRGILHIGPLSSYAARVRSLMLLPPSGAYPNYRLIESLQDPTPYCYEGTIGMATMFNERPVADEMVGVEFTASVALIPSSQVGENGTRNVTSHLAELYSLDLTSEYDLVPVEIYNRLVSEAQRLGVVSPDDVHIAHLPSLEYTIYQSSVSTEIAARIVLEPRDYLHFSGTTDGGILMLRPHNDDFMPRFGLNTLRMIGVFLDYELGQIGFCEPI